MGCNLLKTRPCGRGCRSLLKPCKIDGTPGTPKGVIPRRVAADMTVKSGERRKCKPGKTRPCGKSCRSIYKPCKVDGTPGVTDPNKLHIEKPFEPNPQKMKLAVNARQRAIREKDPKRRRILEDRARVAFANAYVDQAWFTDRRKKVDDLSFLTVPFTGDGIVSDQRGQL